MKLEFKKYSQEAPVFDGNTILFVYCAHGITSAMALCSNIDYINETQKEYIWWAYFDFPKYLLDTTTTLVSSN